MYAVCYYRYVITISKNRNMQCTQANCTSPTNYPVFKRGNIPISQSRDWATNLPETLTDPPGWFSEFAQMIKIDKTQAHDPALIEPYVMLIQVTPLPKAVLSPRWLIWLEQNTALATARGIGECHQLEKKTCARLQESVSVWEIYTWQG